MRFLSMRGMMFGLALVAAIGTFDVPLRADEVVVKNDVVSDFGQAVIVGDFVPGEMAAARLTSPCDGSIVAVQILWLEGIPGHPQSIEQAIHIFAGTGFPTPGAELEYLPAPLMTPGYWNEFRYLDEEQTIPIDVPVTTGQQFYVALEFYNGTDVGGGGPSIVRDINGCQAGKNALYAIPGGWLNFCLFLTGDLAIRAVVDCGFAGPTVGCTFTCNPPSGTVPFQTQMAVGMSNLYSGQTRRIAGRINVTVANQQYFSNWRSGYTNLGPGATYSNAWNQNIPALSAVIGQNFFQLFAQDVTPSPYNQPPYPASGDVDTAFCIVTANAP